MTLLEALRAERDAISRLWNSPNMSGERLAAIRDFYASNVATFKALQHVSVDEARAAFEDYYAAQPLEGDIVAGGSSTAPEPPDEDVWSDRVAQRQRRRRRHRGRRDEDREAEDVYDVLGVK